MDRKRGERIRAARVAAGFKSRKAFGEALGVSAPTAERWERGTNEPTPANYGLMAKLTGATEAWLRDGEGPEPDPAVANLPELVLEYLRGPGRGATHDQIRWLARVWDSMTPEEQDEATLVFIDAVFLIAPLGIAGALAPRDGADAGKHTAKLVKTERT